MRSGFALATILGCAVLSVTLLTLDALSSVSEQAVKGPNIVHFFGHFNNDGLLSLFLPRPSPFIFSPFSSGHRACIGKVFAMVSFKLLFAILNEVNFIEGGGCHYCSS